MSSKGIILWLKGKLTFDNLSAAICCCYSKKTVACGCCWGSRLLKKIADSWLLLFSSDVRDVGLRSEYSDELVLVVVDVALHDLHART